MEVQILYGDLHAVDIISLVFTLPRKGRFDGLYVSSADRDTADGLWNPASIAFGTGKSDRQSVFFTNYALLPPATGDFGPAVLKFDVGES